MEPDEKPSLRRRVQRSATPAPAESRPEPGPVEPTRSAGPASRWLVEEFLVEEDHSGLLPSARELAFDASVDPTAPRILFAEFQAESAHRRLIEAQIVTGEIRRANRGQVFALCVLMLDVAIGGSLVYAGHDAAGTVIAGANLVAGAALFVRESKTRDRDESEDG